MNEATDWKDSASWRERCDNLPGVVANAELLDALEQRWRGHVVARTSMHDLLFTRIGDDYPFPLAVLTAWKDGIFEMRLVKDGGLLITADRCRPANAVALANSLLLQLAAEDEPPSPDVASIPPWKPPTFTSFDEVFEFLHSDPWRGDVSVDAGLNDAELRGAEERFGFQFPPDLAEFLGVGLPTGKNFPDWRGGTAADLRGRLEWPVEGLLFDVKNNVFWMEEWGERPGDTNAAVAFAAEKLAAVPQLVPVSGHRYLPSVPHDFGNPVLSAYQSDVICYGSDLLDYFNNDLALRHQDRAWATITRDVPVWGRIVELNGG